MTDPTQQTTPTRDEAVRDESKVTTAMIDAAFKVCPAGAISEIGTGGMQRMLAAALASAPAPASGRVDAVAVEVTDEMIEAGKEAANGWTDRYMDGAEFVRWDDALPDIFRRMLELASLSPAATPGLSLPSREWMRDKIAADPDVEDCGVVPAATPVSEAGGEHDARLSEHPAFQAPAGMPGVEEIARVIFSGKLMQPANGPWRDDVMTVGQKFCLYAARDVLSLFAPILAETERATVKRIAQVASEVAAQAGVGASETAGLIVSVLAANPEQTERFMAEGSELFIDGTIRPENGCLTHMAMNGQVVSPTRLRMMKGQSQ